MSRFLTATMLSLLLLGTSLSSAQGPRSIPVISTAPNETTVGTSLNLLAKMVPPSSGTLGQLRRPLVTDTSERLVVVHANAGTTGSAVYTSAGEVNCVMDATNASGVAGKPVLMSTTTAGQCHAQTAALPTSVMIIGYMKSDVTTLNQPALIDVQNQLVGPGGSFTGVTSLGLSMPTEFTVSPAGNITTSGVFTVSKATNIGANLVYAGPNGSTGTPTFRALVAADVPSAVGSCGTTGDLAGTYPNCTVFQATNGMNMKQAVVQSGVLTTTVSGTLSDYNPSGFANASRLALDPQGTTVTITGMQQQTNGDVKKVCNNGTSATAIIVIKHLNAGSQANNRFRLSSNTGTPGEQDDVTLTAGLCVSFWYHASAVNPAWKLDDGGAPDLYRIRPLGMITGDPDPSSPTLLAGNDTPSGWTNHYGRDLKVLHIGCKADVTGVTIDVTHDSSSTSVLATTPCSCGNGVFNACAVKTSPSTDMLIHTWTTTTSTRNCTGTPCGLSFNIVDPSTGRLVIIDGYGKLQ